MRVWSVLATVVTAAVPPGLLVGVPSASATPSCVPWSVTTVASGFGMLENIAFDDSGSMYLSQTSPLGPGAIARMTPDTARTVAVADVSSPGGIVVDGDTMYFTTGNGTAAGLFGTPDGTVDALDLVSGVRSTYARGLVMPNGLARAASGELFATRNLGSATGLTSVGAEAPHEPSVIRNDLGTANGIAIDGETLYVANTFEPELEISVLDVRDLDGPARRIPVDGFGPVTASDDMTVGADGQIYLSQNLAGRVLRIDPESASWCVIGTGMPLTTSVAFGGIGWDRESLYATSFDGTVRKLSPP
ncbi:MULTISPECIES: SMP-30/gluconolactonase/LRE family protein [Nocardiaceae]|uniref:SMP-30/gluconolactonase/LRE family protein n=1 Tax=Nocardiaceae TaxID=85025 RepID=UPI001E2C10FA|nr:MULTISPECIES: SMP-30/gluconolactonase/LRE family protein [Rhodococcus]MCZ4274346.1 SMP-30/gluconolactonase/LRE family protein [Rhodococcus yunnanensis]